MRSSARLSVVLATDTYATLEPVVAALRKQTARDLEIVIVAPAESLGAVDRSALEDFAACRVVHVPAPLSLPVARAAGVRAASAPFVFVGETHCFPRPAMLDRLAAAFTHDRCAAVVPSIHNGNPVNALSWASYLTDYGMWGPGRQLVSSNGRSCYNGLYRCDVLMKLGDRLEELLEVSSEDLWTILRRQGYHARFLPAAEADHMNATELGAMLRIRFFTGVLIGAHRSARWPMWRRLVYIAASPLVPVVLVSRIRAIVRYGPPGQKLPSGTMLGVSIGALAKATGEMLGYLRMRPPSAEGRLTDNELHKLRYARTDTTTRGL